MKKYSSPIMEILTMEKADIVTLSDASMDKTTTFFPDTWEDRFNKAN